MSKRFHFQIPKENVRIEKFEKTGGGKTYVRSNYTEHGRKLLHQTLQVQKNESSKKDAQFIDDIFIQIATPAEVSIKNEKIKIEKLGFELLSYSHENKSLGKAKINKQNLDELTYKIHEYAETENHVRKSYFSVIEDLAMIPVEEKIKDNIDFRSEEEISVIINLYNAISRKERLAINNFILEEIKSLTNDFQLRNFSNGITSIACKLKSTDIPALANDFSTIKEIKRNNISYITASIPSSPMPNPLVVNDCESDSIICIIDSCISDANGIFKGIVVEKYTQLPIGAVKSDNIHGTFVASRCVFGDDIDACLGSHSLTPYCKLIDVSVFGKNRLGKDVNPDDFHLRTVVENTVNRYKDRVKVFNLSLGTNVPINDNEFSDLSKLLDYLSKEHKVLFVVSSGNILNLLGPFPLNHFGHKNSRLGSPGESILSITVGSIAKYNNTNALSAIGEISPFSRIGPGADGGIKPELVAHGGNMIGPYNFAARISTFGITSDGKNLAVDVGTSHSAPLISQYAQKLFDLYPESDPNLVKALLYHFTENRKIHNTLTHNPIELIGFGEPNIKDAIEANEYNSAYIYEGQLDQDNYQYISFHIPDSLSTENKDSKLKIKITITYDPPVNPDNDVEYSQTRIAAQLIKSTNSGMKPISISSDDKYLIPWNPTIKFEKEFSKAYLTGKWELRLRLFCRGILTPEYLQDYAVVIEIIDNNGSTDVHNDIAREFASIYSLIKIKIAA